MLPQRSRHVIRGFSEHKGTSFRIWFVIEQQGTAGDGLFLAAILGISVEVEEKANRNLRPNADTGIQPRYLHGAPLGDSFAEDGATKEKGVGASCCIVLGSAPRAKETAEKTHRDHTLYLKYGQKKSTAHSWKADENVV